ncbi:C4-dicarboxylate ABC transporter, partial [Vibrio fortis]
MKKLIGTVMTAAALLVGCGQADEAATEAKIEPIDINMSLVFTQNELLAQELVKVTDKIRERT